MIKNLISFLVKFSLILLVVGNGSKERRHICPHTIYSMTQFHVEILLYSLFFSIFLHFRVYLLPVGDRLWNFQRKRKEAAERERAEISSNRIFLCFSFLHFCDFHFLHSLSFARTRRWHLKSSRMKEDWTIFENTRNAIAKTFSRNLYHACSRLNSFYALLHLQSIALRKLCNAMRKGKAIKI